MTAVEVREKLRKFFFKLNRKQMVALSEVIADSGNGGGGGSSSLSDLTDVDISNPEDGQILVYSASESKWIPSNSGKIIRCGMNMETGRLDLTDAQLDNLKAGDKIVVEATDTVLNLYSAAYYNVNFILNTPMTKLIMLTSIVLDLNNDGMPKMTMDLIANTGESWTWSPEPFNFDFSSLLVTS